VKAPILFVFLSAVGVAEAFYHAWLEKAFSTNYSLVTFAPYSSFAGIPYWLLGVVWYPLILVVGLWATNMGRKSLGSWLLILLSIGNITTVYFWYLDSVVVHAYNSLYLGLYATNYALTGLVVAENWSGVVMKDFAVGTIIGLVVGIIFGVYGMAAIGILGGVLGALSGYTSTR
jgi:hypothetical protein